MSTARYSVLKVGGSIVTHKHRPASFYSQRTEQIAIELARYKQPLVIVHGTGSFGKPPAIKYGYLDGFLSKSQLKIVSEVSMALRELRGRILRMLLRAGVPATELNAAAVFQQDSGLLKYCDIRPVKALLDRGMVPVISGDIVIDQARDFSVCSSDAMAARLALDLPASRLIFATDMPGVMDYSEDPAQMLPTISPERVLDQTFVSDINDVSGAMASKVVAGFAAAQAGIETIILDGRVPHILLNALQGLQVPGTRILASSNRGLLHRSDG
jgi:isopentenyl phosphate kinase